MRIRIAATSAAVALTATAGARTFEDTFGRTIEAELLSHWGLSTGMVKIEKDGKPLTVRIQDFSEKDQGFIRDWVAGNPGKLDAITDPPPSGAGVVSGSKWFFLRGGSRPVQVEFRAAGRLNKNGVPSESGRWNTNFDEAITMRWSGIRTQAFSTALIGGRVYADDRHKNLLVRLDRLPGTPTKASVAGKTFVLTNVRHLEPWTGNDTDRVAVVEFKDGGRATVAGREFEWTVAGGTIQIKHRSGYASFGACAKDIYIDSRYNVLWEVAPPEKKR